MIVLAMNSGGLTSPSETVQAGELPQVPQQSLGTAVMEFNNLHSSDAEGNSQPPLTQDEFLAILKWKLGNDELSDEMVKAIEPILYTRDRMLPAGWRFVGGQIKEIGQHGIVQTWQIKLETNGLSEPLVIRKSSIGFLAYETKVEPAKVPETMVSLNSLVDEFNAKRLKLESRTEQLHEISPHHR